MQVLSMKRCERPTYFSDLGSASASFWSAVVQLDDGSELGLSQYDYEAPYWFADSLIGPNSFPHFVHGEGDRSCAKRNATAELEALLNAARDSTKAGRA